VHAHMLVPEVMKVTFAHSQYAQSVEGKGEGGRLAVPEPLFKRMTELTQMRKVVAEDVSAARRREADLAERDDVLSLLLQARDEEGRGMTDAELRDELFTMLAAGHETTATGLAFAVDLLLRHPSALARLREAIADDDESYVAAVGKETLRLRPVIDAAERTLTKPRTVGGWELPPGIKVYPAIALVHYRPDLYPDPEEFRPERFADDGAESYSWLPFGGGIRRCIGAALAQAEMSEVLRVVASRVDLEPVRDGADPVVLRGITLVPKHGVPVRVGGRRDSRAAEPAGVTASQT